MGKVKENMKKRFAAADELLNSRQDPDAEDGPKTVSAVVF